MAPVRLRPACPCDAQIGSWTRGRLLGRLTVRGVMVSRHFEAYSLLPSSPASLVAPVSTG